MSRLISQDSSQMVSRRFNPSVVGTECGDWIALLKPRVISLVVFTGVAGLIMAPVSPGFLLGVISIVCICLASGAAGAINMWYDRDIDQIMNRTATRPIPSGRIEPRAALVFGLVLSVVSVVLMWLSANALAAGLLAFSIFFYAVVYTMWLKRSTPQNIVIGGAAGAFPPMIGWAAASGSLSIMPIVMFLVVFLWTPPHFWSLSLYACKDYTRAGIPMLPVVSGEKHTRRCIVFYTVSLVAVSLLPAILGLVGFLYTVAAGLLGIGFLYRAVAVLHEEQDEEGRSLKGDKAARKAFRFSLLYLFLLFSSLLADHFCVGWGLL